jgi:opacity protein-like surface antigen
MGGVDRRVVSQLETVESPLASKAQNEGFRADGGLGVRTIQWICVLAVAAAGATAARAQAALDVNIGFGSAHDSASGAGLDGASSFNAFGSCTPGSGDAFCQATPGLNGFFLCFGADVMLFKRFGVGADFTVQPSRTGYGPLQSRQSFFDADAIYAPINNKRVELRLLGGVGAARTSFSITQSGCIGTAVCSTAVEPIGSATHVDLNAGVGVQIYLTNHIFIRPQFDVHYVPNLTQQYGSNFVPEGTIWLGYTFGEK